MDYEDFDLLLSVLRSETSCPGEVKESLRLISDIFQEDLSTVEMQVYVAMAVDSRQGILNFLINANQNPDHSSSGNITQSFEVLEYLVTNFKESIEPHADSIIRWCLGTLLQETAIRSPSLKLMKLLISSCSCAAVDMKNVVLRLKMFVDKEKKLCSTLRHFVFSVMGEVCIFQPAAISDVSDWFIDTLVRVLNEHETAKSKSITLVEGCFTGLLGYIVNFELPDEKIPFVYKHVKEFCRLGGSGERHTANRAAVRLYVKCASKRVFAEFICKDANSLIDIFSEWIADHQSAEHRNIGLLALTETYRQITCAIASLNEDEAKKLFENVKKECEVLLKKELSTSYIHKRAVVGLAELSAIYMKFGYRDELVVVLNTLYSFFDSNWGSEALALNIYIESIAKILAVLEDFPTFNLCRLSVLLIERFPRIPSNFKLGSAVALESSFMAFFPRGAPELESHVRVVLYQGLIRSCSHPIHIDVQLMESDLLMPSVDSYKSFLPLWQHLLTIKRRATTSAVGSIVYDSFIVVFIELISKLDLSLLTNITERSDPSLAYEAKTPTDFQIFVNLVDLFYDVIPDSTYALLLKWLPFIFREVMRLSKNNPLVSGFYKILAVTFQVAGPDFVLQDSDLLDEMVDFIKNVIPRILSQKDDLQISCLKMILQAPLVFIEPHLDRLDSALSAAVRVGAGYPELLQLLITSLDTWLSNLERLKMQRLLQNVLPLMRNFLHSSGNKQRSDSKANNIKKKLKVGGKVKKKIVVPADKQSLALQKQFILFLGKLEPSFYSAFTEPVEHYYLPPGNSLHYVIPFHDSRPSLELNGLVPLILDRACSSGDRSTRVTACELMHAVLLIAIERTQKPQSNPELFKKLLSTALLLSCDSDKVVHDLFSPLLLQICRYYSGKVQAFSKETAAVIEVLTEGCAHQFDSSIRDFSGLCIREFVVWSKRQQGEVLDTSPGNIRAIIRTICMHSSHPDQSKRLGAAVMFNNVYAEIREDTKLVSTYWFQLYHCFLHSLEICDDGESARVLLSSIDHIRRPMIEMKHIFLVLADDRRIPEGFRGGTLNDLAIYTFHKGQSLNTNVRKVSRSIFMALLGVFPGRPSMREFLSMHDVTANCKIENLRPGHIVAVLDYVNWLLEEKAIDLETFHSVNVFDLSASLLLQVLQQKHQQLETINCLLRFYSNTTMDIGIESSENLARLLFNLKIPVLEEFVAFLSKLRANKPAMSAFTSCLPRLDKDYLENQLQHLDQISFFLGFEILDRSMLLSESYAGNDLVAMLFESLFYSSWGHKVISKFIDPHFKKYLMKMLRFAFKCGVSVEVMFKCLNDNTLASSDSVTTTKGDVFFNTYKDLIVDYILENDATGGYILKQGQEGVRWLLKILKLCQRRSCNPKLDVFIQNYLQKWNHIEEIAERNDVRFTLLELLSSNKEYGCFVGFEGPFNWLHKILRSKIQSVQDIVRAFSLLPHLSTLNETLNDELTTSLTIFRRQKPCYFDMGPYTQRSENGTAIQAIYKGLLSSLKATSSIVVLKFSAENMARHLGVISLDDIDLTMASLVKSAPQEHILKMGNELFLLAKSPMDMDSAIFIRDRLAAMLQSCPEESVMAFYSCHLAEMYENVMAECNHKEWRLQLKNKTTSVRLLEVLYLKTSINQRQELQNQQRNIPGLFKAIINSCCSLGQLPKRDMKLWRAYNCACVKLLCAFVCQTREESYYRAFLFRLPIWKFVTDFEQKYEFSMDFSQIPKRKKILTSIRQSHRSDSEENVVYPQSQVLFESSLQEDVTKFDMSNSALSQNARATIDSPQGVRIIELELDSLNEHEIIAHICGVIEHMTEERIKPSESLPCWLVSFKSVLTDGLKWNNSKLLVLKVIYNLQWLVKPYASHCAADILSTVVSLLSETGANYFVLDLMQVLLDWRPDFSNSQKDLTSAIKYLISRPNTKRKDIMKYIIEHVKSLVEVYKGIIHHTEIADFLLERTNDELDEFQCYASLHLASVILTNKICPSGAKHIETLFNWLLKCMKANNKNYQLASEVLGQALNSFRDIENFAALSEEICNNVIYLNRKKTKYDTENIDVSRLHYIHKFYPEISSHEFVAANLEVRILQDSSSFRRDCLEMLLSHVKRGQRLQEAANLILESLKANIPAIIDLSIKIFLEYVSKMESSELPDILLQIIKHTSHPVAEVRLASFEALIRTESLMPNMSEELKTKCKAAMLKRLNDVDDDCRKICERYLYDLKLSHKNVRDKWLSILHDMYSQHLESDFVSYSCALLLGGVTFGSSYDLPLFDHPLSDCSYSNYQILSSWRARYSTLAPMFAPSVAGELVRLDLDIRPISPSAYQKQIRATAQHLLFSPTLSDESVANFLSPATSQETQNDEVGVFKKPNVPLRFFKTNKFSSSFFARRAVAAKDREEAEVKERAKRRDTDVKLYRYYRKGDFPDIQIKHCHFIEPLIALARKDSSFAKELLVHLFSATTSNTAKDDHFMEETGATLNTMLETTFCDPLFVCFVFQVALKKDLVLDSGLVCIVAKSSGLFTLGSLLIEQSIIQFSGSGESRHKRRKDSEDELSTRWLHLAQLFQELQDADGQQGIFLDKLDVKGAPRNAICYEAGLNWPAAANNYLEAFKEQTSVVRQNFYFQSYLKCLANICEWSQVKNVIRNSLHSDEQLWEDPWCSEVLLPLHLRSEMMISLQNNTDSFQKELNKNPSFYSKFPLEQTIASWLDENFPKTLTCFNQSCLSLLSNWSQVNNWDTNRKESCLLDLQLLSEINDIVGVVSAVSKVSSIEHTLKNWSVSNPTTQSDLIVWDARLALRKRFAIFLEDKQVSDSDLEEVRNSVRKKELMLTTVALELENVYIAKKYCLASERSNGVESMYYWDLIKALDIKLNNKYSPRQKVEKYLQVWNSLEQRIDSSMDIDGANCSNLNVKTRRNILSIISSLNSLAEGNNININHHGNLKDNWKKNAEAILEALGNGENQLVQKGEVYVEVAKFHRKYGDSNEEIVKAILKAMSCNNCEARNLFGWVLTMDEVIESPELIALCDSVPTWMFLLWRNQLLAFLANGKSNLIKNIIRRIGLEYPKSLSHSFRVSLESYSKTMLADSFVEEIRKLVLSDAHEEAFVNAISRVASPVLKLKYYLEKVLVKCDDLGEARKALKETYDLIVDEKNGTIYKVLETYKDEVQAIMAETNLESLRERLKRLFKEVDAAPRHSRQEQQLKLYSPWLSSFQTSATTHDLEIPGQYSGHVEPNVRSHIRVVGFKQELRCLESKRCPFKLTMFGNDAKEYSFLVKFGEDLRQDERIQQVLKHMRNTMHSKKLTSDVRLEGFSVIPLTSACGVIQWIDSTKSLKTLIAEKIPLARIRDMQGEHMSLLAAGAPKNIRNVGLYVWAYGNLTDEDAVEGYRRRVNGFPEFALRDAFCGISSSPEQMVYLRRNFAKSLAAMSIGHWLIGVGDRHLDNTLVSTRTGCVIGIDFGIAFGFATQSLIPVELIPFRLTPQLVNVLSPLKESGWLKQTMIRSLRVLREDPSTLLAMLEVFVLEPTLDWKQQAERLAKELGVEDLTDLTDYYPRHKIDSVERKLKGTNPTCEIERDLQDNSKLRRMSQDVFPRILSIVKGKPTNARACVAESDLSPEEQVTALIDLASDPLVLSFTYIGWNPWL